MTRVYIRMPSQIALKALAEGFSEGFEGICRESGVEGVWCDDRPRGSARSAPGAGLMIGGPEGDTVLCLDVPDEVFSEMEVCEGTRGMTEEEVERFQRDGTVPEDMEYQHMGYAIIPAEVLKQYGRPRLYDHEYAGASRRELLQAIQTWEQAAPSDEPGSEEAVRRHVQEMRTAVEFFDKVGWLTPLRFTEEAPEDYAAPGPFFRVKSVELVEEEEHQDDDAGDEEDE